MYLVIRQKYVVGAFARLVLPFLVVVVSIGVVIAAEDALGWKGFLNQGGRKSF